MFQKLKSVYSATWKGLSRPSRRATVNYVIIAFCSFGLLYVSILFKSQYVAKTQTISLFFNSLGNHAKPSFLPVDYHLTYDPAGDDTLEIVFAPTAFCGEAGVSDEIDFQLTGDFEAELTGSIGSLREDSDLDGARIISINECEGGPFNASFRGSFFDNALGYVSLDMYLDTYFLNNNYSPKFKISGVRSLTSIEMAGYDDTGVHVRESDYGTRQLVLSHREKSEKIFWFRGFDRWAASNTAYELFFLGVIVGLLCSFTASATFDLSHGNRS